MGVDGRYGSNIVSTRLCLYYTWTDCNRFAEWIGDGRDYETH